MGCCMYNTGRGGSRTGVSSPVESQSGVPEVGYKNSIPIILARTGPTRQRFTIGDTRTLRPGSQLHGLEVGSAKIS